MGLEKPSLFGSFTLTTISWFQFMCQRKIESPLTFIYLNTSNIHKHLTTQHVINLYECLWYAALRWWWISEWSQWESIRNQINELFSILIPRFDIIDKEEQGESFDFKLTHSTNTDHTVMFKSVRMHQNTANQNTAFIVKVGKGSMMVSVYTGEMAGDMRTLRWVMWSDSGSSLVSLQHRCSDRKLSEISRRLIVNLWNMDINLDLINILNKNSETSGHVPFSNTLVELTLQTLRDTLPGCCG